MASQLVPMMEGGVPMVGPPAPDDDISSAGNPRKRKAPSEASAKSSARAKRGAAKVLSSSFTCWGKTPEP